MYRINFVLNTKLGMLVLCFLDERIRKNTSRFCNNNDKVLWKTRESTVHILSVHEKTPLCAGVFSFRSILFFLFLDTTFRLFQSVQASQDVRGLIQVVFQNRAKVVFGKCLH